MVRGVPRLFTWLPRVVCLILAACSKFGVTTAEFMLALLTLSKLSWRGAENSSTGKYQGSGASIDLQFLQPEYLSFDGEIQRTVTYHRPEI